MRLAPELGSGPLTSPLWLISDEWAGEDAAMRQPLMGQAGTLLNTALREAGLQRADVRVDALVPAFRPDAMTRAWGYERLNALIAQHAPKVIVGFGNEVCARLVGDGWPDDGIQKLRGYLWDSPRGRVLASVHPAAIAGGVVDGRYTRGEWTPWRPLLTMDLRKAAQEVALGAPPLSERRVHIVTHPLELGMPKKAIATTKPQGGTNFPFDGVNWLSVDIENTQDLKLACMGFAPSVDEAWVIPARDGWQMDAIRELSESPTPKVLQNGQYDRFFLKRFAGVSLRNQVFDTQLAWHALNPELAGKKTEVGTRKAGSRRTAKSLHFLASIYLRVPYWKNYDFASDEERYTLCGRDVCNTLEIALKQARQLEAA